MEIVRYTADSVGRDAHDEYGVVSDDGTNALRVRAYDTGQVTRILANVAYRGKGLAFNEGDLSDSSNSHTPADLRGRKLMFEVTPPITDSLQRERAVAAYASAVFSLGEGPLSVNINNINGDVSMHIR